MPSERCFFCEDIGTRGESMVLGPSLAHHMGNVVRLKKGERIDLKDGRGRWCVAEVLEPSVSSFQVRVLEEWADLNESPLHVTLCLGLARQDRMDTVVRQLTELGVRRIIGFRARRSQYGLSPGQIEKRLERWRKICAEAICQCRRALLPELLIYDNTQALLEGISRLSSVPEASVLKLTAHEGLQGSKAGHESDFYGSVVCPPREVFALVGPEGGWGTGEPEAFGEAGFLPVSLGPRTLRFETAAVAMVSIVQHRWGDLGGYPTAQREDA